MENMVGKAVIVVDSKGRPHDGLVTADWRGGNEFGALNVVYVNMDEGQTDSCGQKIARDTSVVHRTQQSAPGRYWKYVDDPAFN